MKWYENFIRGISLPYWIEELNEKQTQINIKETIIADLKVTVERLLMDIDDLNKQKKIEEPKHYGVVKLKEAYGILNELANAVYLSDEQFYTTTIEEAKKFSEGTKLQYKKWIKEDFDCDNFSFAAMGYWSQGLKSFAFGIAWSDNHAFNIGIFLEDGERKIYFIEPQTNQYFDLETAKLKSKGGLHYYPVRLIVM